MHKEIKNTHLNKRTLQSRRDIKKNGMIKRYKSRFKNLERNLNFEVKINTWEDLWVEEAVFDWEDFHPTQATPFSDPSLYELPGDNA